MPDDLRLCPPVLTPPGDCPPCGLHRPERNSYFDGRMLTARDMTAEQTYHTGLRHLGHKALHGAGTVCGLKVLPHPQDGCRATHLVLSRGLALDRGGREIVVPADTTIPLAQLIRDTDGLAARLDGSRTLVIGLCRADQAVEFAPRLLPDCDGGLDGTLPARIAETHGYALWAEDAAARPQEREVRQPDLDWVHSLNTADEVPTAVAVDDALDLIWVAAGLEGRATLRGYRALTHALAITLPGWDSVTDIAAPPTGDWLCVAGRWEGREVIALYPRDPGHLAKPDRLIPVEGVAQIAASPITGALFALAFDDAGLPTLHGWSAERLQTATAAPLVTLNGEARVETGPVRAGARVMAVSPDGRQLALLLPGTENGALHLFLVADLLGGGLADLKTGQQTIRLPTGAEAPEALTGAAALAFSYDGDLLHIAARPGAGQGGYLRLFLNSEGPVLAGRGLTYAFPADARTWPALAIAPDERWVYIVTAGERGQRAEEAGWLAVFAGLAAMVPGEVPAPVDPIHLVALDAQLSGGALSLRGERAYVPGAQRVTAGDDPVRGRVAVVEIAETDISAIFEAAIDGCTPCAPPHCVALATIPGYRWNDAAPPRIVPPEEAGAGTHTIDNLTFRPLVPSNVTLMEAILEIAARGVESGPPGPRGEDGVQGQAGQQGRPAPALSQVAVDPAAAQPRIEPVAGQPDQLRLILPPAPAGLPGQRGRSIAAVAFGTPPTPRLEPLAGPDSDLRLILPLPQAAQRDPEDYQFVRKINWRHGDILPFQDLLQGGLLDDMQITLSQPVTNPEVLVRPAERPVPHLWFSGVVELRLHVHRDGMDGNWTANLGESRTIPISPRFQKLEEVFDGQTLIIPLAPLWQQAQTNVLEGVPRARLDVLLHGAFLRNDKGFPFDGRPEPDVTADLAGVTGGTWRSFVEIAGQEG